MTTCLGTSFFASYKQDLKETSSLGRNFHDKNREITLFYEFYYKFIAE